jgi:hypothetical protein
MNIWQTIALAAVLVTAAPAMAAQRVFVSSTTSSGDLGGLEGADESCQELADTALLGGRWVAWLSTSERNAIDRLFGDGPFLLVGTNEVVAASRAALTSGTLQNDIERDEMGVQVPAAVWTGTDPDGTAADSGSFCADWTDANSELFGQTGASQQTDATWTNANQVFCNLEVRIYCFEQDAAVGAPVLSWTALVAVAILMVLGGAWTIGGSSRSLRSGRRRATP